MIFRRYGTADHYSAVPFEGFLVHRYPTQDKEIIRSLR